MSNDASAHQRIAFVGTGVMGSSMAGHLLDAGYPVVVYNRTRAKAEPLRRARRHLGRLGG